MTWLMFAAACSAAIAVLWIPGSALSIASGLRGFWAYATAPAFSLSVIVLASSVLSSLQIPWSALGLVAVSAALAVLITVVIRLVPALRATARPLRQQDSSTAVAVALGLAAAAATTRFVLSITDPTLFLQAGDNQFHLNAATFILDGGKASPWDLGIIDQPDVAGRAYPSGWHATVALVAQLSGSPTTVAANGLHLVIAALVWPATAVLLTRSLFGRSPALTVAAGALASGVAQFPHFPVSYIGAYPLMFAIAVTPVAVALLVEFLRLSGERLPTVHCVIGLGLSMIAIGGTHPSAALMVGVLFIPPVAVASWRWARETPHARRLAALIALLYGTAVLAAVVIIRPSVIQPDSIRGTTAQSAGEVLLSSAGGFAISALVAGSLLAGLVVAARRRRPSDLVAIGLWLIVGLLYLAATGADEFARLLYTAAWYGDGARVAAFAPVAIIPLAAAGAGAVWSVTSANFVGRHLVARALAVAATLLFATALVTSPPIASMDRSMRSLFLPTDNPLVSRIALSVEDRELIDRIPSIVPEQDLIAGNPADGYGFAYTLARRQVLTPHLLRQPDADTELFLAGFSAAKEGEPACEATKRLGVDWILVLHPDRLLPGAPRPDGLEGLARSNNVTLAASVGSSALYEVTGCER